MLKLITSFLLRRNEPVPVDAAEAHRAVFANMVERHLQNRRAIPDFMMTDMLYNVPKYVVIMCQDLCGLIARPDVDLIDVLRIEKTVVGHSDYQTKLALRCYHKAIEKS
jgi:hypothetical protein